MVLSIYYTDEVSQPALLNMNGLGSQTSTKLAQPGGVLFTDWRPTENTASKIGTHLL
jgi:hypothetical protein